jgi:protein Tex
LRIRSGDNPLDASAIHPESYPIANVVLKRAGISSISSQELRQEALNRLQKEKPFEKLSEELGAGVPTLQDIIEQLARPGRDPRQDMPAPILRSDIIKMEDLSPGMRLKGTVRNVVDFGAFIDIGVKQDGLLHRSQIPARGDRAGRRSGRGGNTENRGGTRAHFTALAAVTISGTA